MNRRNLLTRAAIGIAAVAGIAGCSTGPPATSTAPHTEMTPDTGNQTDTESVPAYTFAEGESYTYRATFQRRMSEEKWDVGSVDGNNLTVTRTSTINGKSEETRVSGTQKTIYTNVASAHSAPIKYFSLLKELLYYGQQGDLTTGNVFTVPARTDLEYETATVEVAGETNINGVTCWEIRIAPADDQSSSFDSTVYISDNGFPFAVAANTITSTGSSVDIEMTDFNHPAVIENTN